MTSCSASWPRQAAFLLLATLLGGCSTPAWLCWLPPGPSRITIEVEDDANQDRALALDLVFITDVQAAAAVKDLTARDWFLRRTQLQRDWRDALTIRSWEVTPGQRVSAARVSPPCNLSRVLVFADYALPGDHRAQLGTASQVSITLGVRDFTVTP